MSPVARRGGTLVLHPPVWVKLWATVHVVLLSGALVWTLVRPRPASIIALSLLALIFAPTLFAAARFVEVDADGVRHRFGRRVPWSRVARVETAPGRVVLLDDDVMDLPGPVSARDLRPFVPDHVELTS